MWMDGDGGDVRRRNALAVLASRTRAHVWVRDAAGQNLNRTRAVVWTLRAAAFACSNAGCVPSYILQAYMPDRQFLSRSCSSFFSPEQCNSMNGRRPGQPSDSSAAAQRRQTDRYCWALPPRLLSSRSLQSQTRPHPPSNKYLAKQSSFLGDLISLRSLALCLLSEGHCCGVSSPARPGAFRGAKLGVAAGTNILYGLCAVAALSACIPTPLALVLGRFIVARRRFAHALLSFSCRDRCLRYVRGRVRTS